MPRGQPLTPDQIDEAVRLQAQLWKLDRIAERLGVHPDSVSRALGRHNRRVLARMEKRRADEKAAQVEQLKTVASEAFDAWLHSKTPRELTRTTIDGDGDGGTSTEVTEESTHHCDSTLLNQARGALADIRKILGLDAPAKQEVSGPDGGAILLAAEAALKKVYGAADPGTGAVSGDGA